MKRMTRVRGVVGVALFCDLAHSSCYRQDRIILPGFRQENQDPGMQIQRAPIPLCEHF